MLGIIRNIFKPAGKPSQAEMLMGLLTMEVVKDPFGVALSDPSHSGHWTVIRAGRELLITVEAGLCGSPWYEAKINGLPISVREVKKIVRLTNELRAAKKIADAKAQANATIERLLERHRKG